MGCLRKENKEYLGKIIQMSSQRKSNRISKGQNSTKNTEQQKK